MVLLEKAPAKITLLLDVIQRRADGYHDVEMIMTTIDLADRVAIQRLAENRIEVMADNQYVPNDGRNLAYKAARIFKETYQITEGVNIDIEKNIPVSAGLGGGSSDAAAVLRGLNRVWECGKSLDELAELGAMIGSDVPFCVYSATALATGRGEKLHKLPLPPPCWIVLAKPDFGVSTRTIFQEVDVANISHPNTKEVMRAIHMQDFPRLAANIGNVLEPVTFSRYPEARRIKDKMQQYGAEGVLMSGSGPVIYGLVERATKARRIYNGLRGFCNDVYTIRIVGHP